MQNNIYNHYIYYSNTFNYHIYNYIEQYLTCNSYVILNSNLFNLVTFALLRVISLCKILFYL